MKTRIISLIAAVVLMLGAVSLVSCNKVPEVPYTTVTRVTFDAVASVEIIVNFQNDVVAVTPLNDAAEIILSGEDFIKKAPDKVIAEIAKLAAKAGYLAAVDSVNISVSGSGEYVDAISEMIKEKTEKVLKKQGVERSVEFVSSATNEELRQLNRRIGYYSEEVLETIPDTDLIFAMAQCRVQGASLPDTDFGYGYFSGADRMTILYQKNGIAELIKNVGETQTETYNKYKAAFDKYKLAADAIDSFIYDSCLNPSSEYRMLKNAVREALENIEGGRETYDAAVEALEVKRAALAEELKGYSLELSDAFKELTELEYAFDQEMLTEYRAKAMDIFNASIEEEKTFMDKFTAEYKEAIEAAKNSNETFKSKLG